MYYKDTDFEGQLIFGLCVCVCVYNMYYMYMY